MINSWKPEVYVHSQWSGNGLRFRSEDEAYESGYTLFQKWSLVEGWRARPSKDEATYAFKEGKNVPLQSRRATRTRLQPLKGDDDNDHKS